MNFKTIDELLEYTSKIKGKTFKEFDDKGNLSKGLKVDKGLLGKVVETGFYHYPNNNKAEADFADLGVELKVSGYIKHKNGMVSAKERIKLSSINYYEIVKDDFDYSKLLFKSKKILIIWYEYKKNTDISDFVITDYQLYDMSPDELIIKNDYKIIQEKVLKGRAQDLSEGDTSFLGACTSAADSSVRVKQPYSNELAKPRAFDLKNSYITGILRNANLVFEKDNVQYKTIDEYVYAQIKKYIGKTQIAIYESLVKDYDFDVIPKNINKMISDKVIGKDNELVEKNDLFNKTNCIIKSIPVDKNDYPLERMSFRNLTLSEFDEDWDNSDWKAYFEEVTIVLLTYEGDKEIKNGFRVLKDMYKISFTADDIDLFKRSYDMVRKAIKEHDIKYLPYPKSYIGQVLEIAPKGVKNDNAYNTFFKRDNTRVCFMLSKDFIYRKLTHKE